MTFYRRNLPHWQPEGAEYFVTFRLSGSLPAKRVGELKRRRKELLAKAKMRRSGSLPDLQNRIQRKIFKKYETLLDKSKRGPVWLQKKKIANIVKDSMHFRDSKAYDLYSYCIMPNHVHIVFRHLVDRQEFHKEKNKYPITKILGNLKRYTAQEANKLLGRTGSFWQAESYDHVIRDSDELERIITYTLNNPVKAGLVRSWQDWPNSYCKPEFLATFD